jgi:hypothetical protein
MTENKKTLSGLKKFWAVITLAGLLNVIGPWLQAFYQVKLISDYFQPWVNAAASALAALTFVAAFAYLRKFGRERLKGRLLISFLLLLLSVAICLFFRLTLGDVFALGRLGTKLVWVIWIIAYLSIFVNVAITLVVVGFLAE